VPPATTVAPRTKSIRGERSADARAWRFREFSTEWRDRLVGSPSIDPVLIEQFRRLAATLHHAQTTSNLKIVMVTSAAPGDGKTMTSVKSAVYPVPLTNAGYAGTQ
jgi:Mrp family chromosome partitioning ATPase